MKNSIITLLLLPAFVCSQTSPGGVGTNLYLWTKADAGITTSGSNVTQWANQAPTSMAAQASFSATSSITFQTNTFNYNPAVAFAGVSGERLFGQFTTAPGNRPTFFAVVRAASNNADFGSPYSLGFTTGGGAPGYGFQTGPKAFTLGSAGFQYSPTPNAIDKNSIVRANYTMTAPPQITGAYSSYNGKANAVAVDNRNVTSPNAFFEIGGRTWGVPNTDPPGDPSGTLDLPARIYSGLLAEVIHYNSTTFTGNDTNKIESYLAIKYAITLDNSLGGANGDYTSSAGTLVWNADDNSSYHNQLIGIARDDNSALLQKQSHTADDTTRIYLSTLQTSNAGNSGSFGSNGSFVIAGNNAGQMYSTGSTEFPTGKGIFRRLDREWKITNTNFPGTFSMDFIPKYTNVTASDLRVLVDDDGDFSNATVYDAPDVTIAFNSGVITVSGISNTLIPSGSTKYLTLASLSATTPLPVTLTAFNAMQEDAAILLTWTTVSEQNNAYFMIERSANGAQWQQIAKIPGAGNSSQSINYRYTDVAPLNGVSYYRLKQTDFDGTYEYSPIREVRLQAPAALLIYPNPVSNEITLKADKTDAKKLKVVNLSGKDFTHSLQISSNETETTINVSGLASGVYIIQVGNRSYKILKQ